MIERYTEPRAQITCAHAREGRRNTNGISMSGQVGREQKYG